MTFIKSQILIFYVFNYYLSPPQFFIVKEIERRGFKSVEGIRLSLFNHTHLLNIKFLMSMSFLSTQLIRLIVSFFRRKRGGEWEGERGGKFNLRSSKSFTFLSNSESIFILIFRKTFKVKDKIGWIFII